MTQYFCATRYAMNYLSLRLSKVNVHSMVPSGRYFCPNGWIYVAFLVSRFTCSNLFGPFTLDVFQNL
jgi:hypothetical protein